MNHTPEAAVILDLIEAFRRSKTMFTAVRLGVFESLSKRPQSEEELAKELGLDRSALVRLLSGCVTLGLVYSQNNIFHNTPAAALFLVNASPGSLAGYITYSDQSLYQLWGRLDDAVREGTNRWNQVFGSRQALFDHYFRDDVSAGNFLGGMHGFGQLASGHVVRAFDLSRFELLVDLGGATGHLCIAACEAWPHLRAEVLDLPIVEKFALRHITVSPAAERISFHAADFFTDPLPPSSLYALGRILHDWNDEKIKTLLDKIVAALPSGGALLIVETLLNDDRSGPMYSAMQDLNMLVCTEGRERTRSEYVALLKSAGFSGVDFKETGSLVDAILAIKGNACPDDSTHN